MKVDYRFREDINGPTGDRLFSRQFLSQCNSYIKAYEIVVNRHITYFKFNSFQATEQNPPALSATPQSPDSLSHPVPRRPPKGERRTQAKEFFRSHVSQRVGSPSSDSEYGNIDEIRLGMSTSEHEGTNSSRQEDIESNYINKTSSGPLSLEASHVIKSQREAMRLKINLMKESSVDEDFPFESDDGGITSVKSEDIEDQSTRKRPSTPLSIQRSPLTISSVSIT